MLLPTVAAAQDAVGSLLASPYLAAFARLEQHEIAALALILGVVLFAVVTAILLVRTRAQASAGARAAREQIAALTSDVDQLTGLLLSEPHVLVSWAAASDQPDVIGETTGMTGRSDPQAVLAFRTWLTADDASAMADAVAKLRADGESFSRSLTTPSGRRGRGGGPRHRGPGGDEAARRQRDRTQAHRAQGRQCGDRNRGRRVTDLDRLAAIARMGARRGRHARLRQHRLCARGQRHRRRERDVADIELFDGAARTQIERACSAGGKATLRLPALVAGQRRSFDVTELATAHGRVGMGIDATEIETLRGDTARMAEAHRRTLDHLATGSRHLRRQDQEARVL